MSSEEELARLYDALARYQWLRRSAGGGRPDEGLEMHKRLKGGAPGTPAAGTADIHGWLFERTGAGDSLRALDVGCGFGATLFDWARRAPTGTFTGLTLSPYQVRRARQLADQRGLGDRCTFRCQSYSAPVEGTFDVVLSIESLFHAGDLARTARNLADSLAPGGELLLVEDMARGSEVAQAPAGAELLSRWSTAHLYTRDDYRDALAGAGLVVSAETDLTPQVPTHDASSLERRRRRLTRLRTFLPLPVARGVVDAFLGGLALDELYRTERMRYVALTARRGAA